MARLLDQMGRRYGCRPSRLLRGSWDDLVLDTLCYLEGLSAQDAALRRLTSGKGMVFPTVTVVP
jgi:hypothetical protein